MFKVFSILFHLPAVRSRHTLNSKQAFSIRLWRWDWNQINGDIGQKWISKHRHACFRRAVGQSPHCRLQGTVVSVIIVFVLDFFVFVLFLFFVLVLVFVNENRTDVDAGKAGVRVASGARLMRLRFTLEEVVGRPAIKCVHSWNLTVETWLIQFVYFLFCFLFCTEYLFTVQRSTYCCMLHCEGSL